MGENEIEELKKQVQNFIRSNEVPFILNGKPLKISKIQRLSILSLKSGDSSNENNYSFEGEVEVFVPVGTMGDMKNLSGDFSGYAQIDTEQINGKLKGIKIIKVSSIMITTK
ncbi:MAG: hypothetical protein NC410_02695 [Oscillibacter sp.]|nr:hypothetical protein [Oscillibacter sp.]